MVEVLKISVCKSTVGSNPTLPGVVNDLLVNGQRIQASVHSLDFARLVHGVYHPHLKKKDAVWFADIHQ